MDGLNKEVQYRTAKWIFTNMLRNGQISMEEYEKLHIQLLDRFDPPMRCLETPGFYVQEVQDEDL